MQKWFWVIIFIAIPVKVLQYYLCINTKMDQPYLIYIYMYISLNLHNNYHQITYKCWELANIIDESASLSPPTSVCMMISLYSCWKVFERTRRASNMAGNNFLLLSKMDISLNWNYTMYIWTNCKFYDFINTVNGIMYAGINFHMFGAWRCFIDITWIQFCVINIKI